MLARLAVVAFAASVVALATGGGATLVPNDAEAKLSPHAEAELTLTLNCGDVVRADVTWSGINPKTVVLVIIKDAIVDSAVLELRGGNRSGSRSLEAADVGSHGLYTALAIVSKLRPDPDPDPTAPLDESDSIILRVDQFLTCAPL